MLRGRIVFREATNTDPQADDPRFTLLDYVNEDNYALVELHDMASRDLLRRVIAALANEGLIAVGRLGELDGRNPSRETTFDAAAALADERSWDPAATAAATECALLCATACIGANRPGTLLLTGRPGPGASEFLQRILPFRIALVRLIMRESLVSPRSAATATVTMIPCCTFGLVGRKPTTSSLN